MIQVIFSICHSHNRPGVRGLEGMERPERVMCNLKSHFPVCSGVSPEPSGGGVSFSDGKCGSFVSMSCVSCSGDNVASMCHLFARCPWALIFRFRNLEGYATWTALSGFQSKTEKPAGVGSEPCRRESCRDSSHRQHSTSME